jgi:hypothetical protein
MRWAMHIHVCLRFPAWRVVVFFSQRKQALYTDLYSYRRPSESRRRRRLVVDLALMYLPPACFRLSPAIYMKVTDEFIQISIDPLHAPTRSIFFLGIYVVVVWTDGQIKFF